MSPVVPESPVERMHRLMNLELPGDDRVIQNEEAHGGPTIGLDFTERFRNDQPGALGHA